MKRRALLKRSTSALALSAIVAGCSGSDETQTDTATSTPAVTGEVVENTVSGLEIAETSPAESDDDRFRAVLTVRNTGDQETNPGDYDYGITIFDSEGSDITTGVTGTSYTDGVLESGEEGDLTISTEVDGDIEDVASYEITVQCDDLGPTAAYCE